MVPWKGHRKKTHMENPWVFRVVFHVNLAGCSGFPHSTSSSPFEARVSDKVVVNGWKSATDGNEGSVGEEKHPVISASLFYVIFSNIGLVFF